MLRTKKRKQFDRRQIRVSKNAELHKRTTYFHCWTAFKKVKAGFSDKIIPNDEAHLPYYCSLIDLLIVEIAAFWVQRTHTWLSKYKCIHNSQRVAGWCGFWNGSITGTCLFENEAGQQLRLLVSISRQDTEFFLPKLGDIYVEDMWFQHDDVTCHTTYKNIQSQHDTFSGRVLSSFGDQICPPKSCDLTPLDLFLSAHLNSKAYVNKLTFTRAITEEI